MNPAGKVIDALNATAMLLEDLPDVLSDKRAFNLFKITPDALRLEADRIQKTVDELKEIFPENTWIQPGRLRGRFTEPANKTIELGLSFKPGDKLILTIED